MLSIVDKNPQVKIEGITCNVKINKLIKIASRYEVKKIGFNEKSLKTKHKNKLNKYDVYDDISKFHKIISEKTDIVIFGISGLICLDLFSKLIKSGKTIGIANKECIISLGSSVKDIASKFSTKIIPLDSEHNSIYHLLQMNIGSYKSISITATGGPFLKFTNVELNSITPKQAIKHPIWNMGKKISIVSI